MLITRESRDLGELRKVVPEEVELVAYPVLQLRPWEEPAAWDAIGQELPGIGLLAFSSRHAPHPFREQARRHGFEAAVIQLPAAAVGETTAAACRQAGLRVELVGEKTGEKLAEAIAQRFTPPCGVLFPCGREHREELLKVLKAKGFGVFVLPVYAMEPAAAAELPSLPADRPRAVVLTSPRAAALYWRHTQGRYAAVPHIAWGSTTALELTRLGVNPEVLDKPTPQSLKEALCRIL